MESQRQEQYFDMKEKVLLVSSGGLKKSGVPSVLMTIVQGLNDRYVFDILVHTDEEGYFDKQFLSYGGKIFRFPKKHFSFKPLDRLYELLRPMHLNRVTKKLIRENGPYKVIHCNNDFDASGCVKAAKDEGVPVRICHTHKTWQKDSEMGALTRLYRASCRKALTEAATALIGCSASANDSTFGPDSNAQVVFNPYDEKRFTPSSPLKKVSGLNLIQVGYFNKIKNQLFTLEVLRELKKTGSDFHLTFIGDRSGSYGEKVEKTISEYDLQDQITLLPADADIPKAMGDSNILLLPSVNEGFGIVLIEAQAMGLHCIASDTVPRETDRGGVVFLPVPDGAKVWADLIRSDKSLTEKKIQDCSTFSTESFIDSIERLYSQV